MRPSVLALAYPAEENNDEQQAGEVDQRDATQRARHPTGGREQQHSGQ